MGLLIFFGLFCFSAFCLSMFALLVTAIIIDVLGVGYSEFKQWLKSLIKESNNANTENGSSAE